MNKQQQGYATPAASYGDPRPINTDPREQYYPYRPINTDPREQPQWQPMPPMSTAQPPQCRRNTWRWLGISVAILVVIFGGLYAASNVLTKTITETKSFAVGAQPTIVVDNGNGSVHIYNGPAGQVSVVAHKHTFLGDSDQPTITYTQSGDGQTVTITADDGSGFSFFSFGMSVDFDITIPSQSNLTVQTGNGSQSVTGISGQITLQSGNGSIHASQLSGPMTLTSNNGSVTAEQTNASGSSTFSAGNGSVSFDGTLDPNEGTYLFETGNGSIDVTLPANASLRVVDEVGNGSFASDFTLAGDGTVGTAPYAQVTLHSGNGSIHLHKGN